MQNDGFRAFLKEGSGKGGAPEAESAKSKAERAEEAQRKKDKAKAKQERRVAILKKQEEALAEQNKYRDRAEERRKERAKAVAAGDAAPDEVPEAGMGADQFVEEEDIETKAAALPAGLTFAQAGGREELSQQQHRVAIAQSKYLGGDLEHTHLVKGLDFALLQKMRSEMSASEQARQKAENLAAEKAAAAEAEAARLVAHAGGGAVKKQGAAAAAAKASGRAESDLARGVQRAVFAGGSRPNRALLSGRLLLVFDVRADGPDVPSSLVRSEDELLPGADLAAAQARLKEGAMPAALLAKVTRIYTTGAGARGFGDRPKKPKKPKPWGGDAAPLAMRPLARRPEVHESDLPAAPAPTPAPAAAAAAAVTSAASGMALPSAASAAAAAVAKLSSGGKPPAAPPPAKAAPKRLGGDDVDDMFGDGVGSDYVCAPNEEQAKRAKQEAADASAVRELVGSLAERGGTGGAPGGAPGAGDDDEEEEEMEDEGGAALRQESSAEVDGLLARALKEGKRSALGAEEGEVGEEEDEAEDALLRRFKGKDEEKKKAPKSRDLAMSQQAGDSYAECFPESYQGYNLELHGPDSDDEANVVRSKKEEEEEEPPAEEGEGGKKKKRGMDREKVEELKREAKLSRELVQMEKLMDERKKKRQRRDEGGGSDEEDGGRDVSQNEMF